MNNDTLSLMIVQIMNSSFIKLKFIYVYFSKLKFSILKILKREGYIDNFFVIKFNNISILLIELKYIKNKNVIQSFKRISKQSIKIYTKNRNMPSLMNGLGIFILSTIKGIMTDKEAKKIGIGGKILCHVF